jgi:hypothetical protein
MSRYRIHPGPSPVPPSLQPVSEGPAPANSPFEDEQVKQFILVTCRPCTVKENAELGKHFSNILAYNPQLYSAHCDLTKMSYDLLIVDANKDLAYLEIIAPQAKAAGIPIIVLKRSMCNANDLVTALGGRVIKEILPFADKSDFLNSLLKDKLPKLENRLLNFVKACFKKASSL